MQYLQVLKFADAIRRPWRNGRGETLQLAIWPSGADLERGDFVFRISRASVVEDGPFSRFPGCDRTLVLLDGDGLDLEHDLVPAVRLRALVPYAFSGEVVTTARLVSRSVNDFNVITTRGRARVLGCEVIRAECDLVLDCDHFVVHVVKGGADVLLDREWTLDPFDTLWLESPTRGARMTLRSLPRDSVLLAVRIDLIPPSTLAT